MSVIAYPWAGYRLCGSTDRSVSPVLAGVISSDGLLSPGVTSGHGWVPKTMTSTDGRAQNPVESSHRPLKGRESADDRAGTVVSGGRDRCPRAPWLFGGRRRLIAVRAYDILRYASIVGG